MNHDEPQSHLDPEFEIDVYSPRGLLIVLVGLPIMAYSFWMDGKGNLKNNEQTWLVLAGLAIAMLAIAYHAPIRYVIHQRELKYLWFGRIKAIYNLQDLESVSGNFPTRVIFSGNRGLRLYDYWIGYQPAVAYLRFILDGKQASPRVSPTFGANAPAPVDARRRVSREPAVEVPDASHVEILLRQVTFPNQCVRCGQAVEDSYPLKIWRGLDLVLWKYGRAGWLPAPVCGSCGTRRKWLGYSLTFFYLAFWGVFAWLGGDYFQREFKQHPGTDRSWIVAVPVLAAIYYWRNHLRARLDRLLLGVGVRRLHADGDKVTLNFADPHLAQAVCELSAQVHNARVELAQQILHDNDRPQ